MYKTGRMQKLWLVKRVLGVLGLKDKSYQYLKNHLVKQILSYLDYDGGFFIEAGANDGIKQSNTLYFEKFRNWSGILIEPIPELAEKCKINRPGSITESCALVDFDYKNPTIQMQYCDLMSLVKGAMSSEMEERQHIEEGMIEQNIQKYDLEVPVNTLTSILVKHDVQKIDFFSLDVEGYELNVLKGLDFDRYKPFYMLIEARYRGKIDAFLEHLYEPILELAHFDVLYRLIVDN